MQTIFSETEFNIILTDVLNNDSVKQMKNYRQHFDTSCYEHCRNVAWITYKICKLFNLNYIEATRAAMLHDMFLYDWREKSEKSKGHALNHPKKALEIASIEFNLTQKEKDIILKHMWPLTIIPPKSFEGFFVTIADKLCVIYESFLFYRKSLIYKHSYILWAILFLKF